MKGGGEHGGRAMGGEHHGKATGGAEEAGKSAHGVEKGGARHLTALTGEKKTRVTTAFAKHKSAGVVHANVSTSVGAKVPRSVTLFPVPADVIEIDPEFRDFRYIVVGDIILIIDPDTFEVVEVLS
jgi:Protein of unknown function (DUF1236)